MVNFSRALSFVPWYYYFSTLLHNHNDFQNVAGKLWNHFSPCWASAVIQKTADLRKVHKTTVHSGADGEPLAQVCPPAQISEHIHNARQSWGDRPGLALSCFISNGGLPGDSTCQPPEPPVLLTSAIWAAQPHSISRAWAEARASADPSPPAPPLALPQGMSCPLPAAHTWSKDTNSSTSIPDCDSSPVQSGTTHRSGRERLKHLLVPEGPKKGHVFFFFRFYCRATT